MARSRRGLGKVKIRSRQGREANSTTVIASMSIRQTFIFKSQNCSKRPGGRGKGVKIKMAGQRSRNFEFPDPLGARGGRGKK